MKKPEFFNDLDKTLLVNINGTHYKPSEAKVSVFDRGFLFGDSIYEVCYGLDRQLVFFDDHLDRLYNSAELIQMQVFMAREEILNQAIATLKASPWDDAYIRIILTRGETPISLDPNLSFKNNLVIVVGPKPSHPKEFYKNGLNLYVANTLRNNPKSVDPNAKSGNYLNNVMALAEAKKMGADDALMLNHLGEVTEGTNFNIWIVKDNEFITPPLESGLLKGITRQKVIDILKNNKISYSERVIYEQDLLEADEVFITSSTRGIMPVHSINKKNYGEAIDHWPNIGKITKLYKELINKTRDGLKHCY